MLDLTGRVLTFDDEFNALSVSQSGAARWNDIRAAWRIGPYSEVGFGTSAFVDPGSGINPFSIDAGALTITAVKSNDTSIVGPGTWASGLLHTNDSFAQLYGYFEVRAQLSWDTGAWPAFWLLRADGVAPAEIDVLEAYATDTVHQVVHTGQTGIHTASEVATDHPGTATGFHTYGVDWQADWITFYFDGAVTGRLATPADMHAPMYMLIDLAIENKQGVSDNPKTMLVDYVRAYSAALDAVAIDLEAVSSPDGLATADLHGAKTATSPPDVPPLLRNGSFETTLMPGDPPYALLLPGDKLDGWTVVSGSVELISIYWQAAKGTHSIDMNGGGAGAIEQSFATETGRSYKVQFSMAGNPDDWTTSIHGLKVSAAGHSADFSFDSTGYSLASMGWVTREFVFTATANSTTLHFESLGGGPWGATLDAVSVTALDGTIPTPPSDPTPPTDPTPDPDSNPPTIPTDPTPPSGPALPVTILNGSFETAPAAGDPPYALLLPGAVFDGWKVVSGSVDLISGYWQAADGRHSLDMNGGSPGAIEQSFATETGRSYKVQFSMAGNPDDWTTSIHGLKVSAAGSSADFSFDSAGHSLASMGWVTREFVFTATANTTTLHFESLGGGPWGATLDAVSVTAVGGTSPTPPSDPSPPTDPTPDPDPGPPTIPIDPTPPSGPALPVTVLNGSFETTPAAGDPPYALLLPGAVLDGWTVVRGSVDLISSYWQAADGHHSLDMNGGGPGVIEQSVATEAGQHYELHFSMAGNPDDWTTSIHGLQVSAGDETASYVFDSAGHSLSSMGWQEKVFSFTADSGATTLQFAGLGGGPWGAALDNVYLIHL